MLDRLFRRDRALMTFGLAGTCGAAAWGVYLLAR